MLPSPATSKTGRSGRAKCAPIAAGKPYPIVPSPPEVIQVRGCLKQKCWAVHIWFCPDFRDDDRISLQELTHLPYDILRVKSAIGRAFQGMVLLPVPDLLKPGFLMPVLFEHGEHVPQDRLYIADNRHVDTLVLADFSRVDIDMNDLCMGSKRIGFTGHAVIEPHADQRTGSRIP